MALVAGIIRVIAAFFDILAASASSTKKIYIFNGIYNFLLGIQYYLLNAIAGAISSFAAILRNIIFHKHSGPSSLWALILYLIVVAVINIPAYDGIISILPIIMVYVYTVALYKANVMGIKHTVIFTCALEIIYDMYYHSYVGVAVCIINIVVVLISIIKIKRRQLKTN